MLLVLLLLCACFSYASWGTQEPNGASAGRAVAAEILDRFGPKARVLIVARGNEEDVAFADALRARLEAASGRVVGVVKADPPAAGDALLRIARSGGGLDVIACNAVTASWPVLAKRAEVSRAFAAAVLVSPGGYNWPSFLKASNLVNIANQIAVIAILAAGMTLVIVTGGIDLSVGSLIALSAVVATLLIREWGGAEEAGALAMVLGCLGAVLVCAAVGTFSGLMVTEFAVPPFIVTLAMMLVASGLAFELSQGQSVYQLPDSFNWLGMRADLLGIPNPVVLMALVYLAAHVLMTQTTLGRYIYAVGGNAEAARLAGVPVRGVLLFVYATCGALAGVGGVVLASRYKSGSPTYGQGDELTVIAAVVVGGTSLRGGQGKVLGTLIGAFIIAVIQNGMNLVGVTSYRQRIILGLVILGAVLLDTLRWRGARH
jgi:ribose transport system permease protein